MFIFKRSFFLRNMIAKNKKFTFFPAKFVTFKFLRGYVSCHKKKSAWSAVLTFIVYRQTWKLSSKTNLNAALWKTWDIPGWTSGLYPSNSGTSLPRNAGRYSYMMMDWREAITRLLAAWNTSSSDQSGLTSRTRSA